MSNAGPNDKAIRPDRRGGDPRMSKQGAALLKQLVDSDTFVDELEMLTAHDPDLATK